MTAVSNIINRAYRESNLIGIGVTPTDTEQADALVILQSLLFGTAGFEIGEPFIDWPIGLDNLNPLPAMYPAWSQQMWMYPFSNVRIVVNFSQSQDVWFPQAPDDGARMAVIDPSGLLAPGNTLTLHGNGRTIAGDLEITLTDNVDLPLIYFYRADLGDWVIVSPITANGQMPYPPEFDDYWVTQTAMRLNPRYGRALAAESTAWLQRSLQLLKSRYRQKKTVPAPAGVLNLSTQAYNAWTNRGRVWPWTGIWQGW